MQTSVSPVAENRCTCGEKLRRKTSAMKYRQHTDSPNLFLGSLVTAIYWECPACGKAYMHARQFMGDFGELVAKRHYEFVLAWPEAGLVGVVSASMPPPRRVFIAGWLKE